MMETSQESSREGNKKAPPQRDEASVRVTTQFYRQITLPASQVREKLRYPVSVTGDPGLPHYSARQAQRPSSETYPYSLSPNGALLAGSCFHTLLFTACMKLAITIALQNRAVKKFTPFLQI
jgi:hypothetical protein